MHAHAHSDVVSFLQRLLISKAHCTGACGLVKNTSTIPSPVGNRSSLPATSARQNDGVFRTISFNWPRNVDCSLVASFEYPTISMHKTCAISTSGPNSTSAVLVRLHYVYRPSTMLITAQRRRINQDCRMLEPEWRIPASWRLVCWKTAVGDRGYRGGR